ncbi:hypothetical protein [Rhodoferax sp. GW822-FHT02A01]|uniref:hypothetical protein n=1 Tax=Rhodoferax sp. GW822-FHT02A01 TaxID=3141537 RepID=UPI00315DEBED
MTTPVQPTLKRVHAKRLREVYRSAGWPCLDVVEVELLAAGLLERIPNPGGLECVRVTDAGIQFLAGAAHSNRKAFSAHEALVDQVAQAMARDGRLVWKGLSLRAMLPAADEASSKPRWKMCNPDVFSIRNSSRPDYLEPIVHEIKVSRADLLGDLKQVDKRNAYLDIGGQCWYVLGCNAKGQAIGEPEEIPMECGVMLYANDKLEVLRMAPRKEARTLSFSVWMALAKAAPSVIALDAQMPVG